MKRYGIEKVLGVLGLSVLFVCGCMSQQSKASKAEIISSLESKRRNEVAVALWALDKNGFAIPKIEFDKPYSRAKPELKKLIQTLSQLPESRLKELDKSLNFHRNSYSPIYSPAWVAGKDGWIE